MRPILVLAVLVLLAACGRFAPGFIVTDDGRTIANNDQNNRELVVDSIRTQLDQQLGGHWRTAVELPELPVYQSSDSRSDYPGGWHWAKATASVTLVGDGTTPLPMTTASVRQAVLDYLSPKVEHPTRNLTVTVTSLTDAARFNTMTTTVAATTSTPTADANGQRRYTVQTGTPWRTSVRSSTAAPSTGG